MGGCVFVAPSFSVWRILIIMFTIIRHKRTKPAEPLTMAVPLHHAPHRLLRCHAIAVARGRREPGEPRAKPRGNREKMSISRAMVTPNLNLLKALMSERSFLDQTTPPPLHGRQEPASSCRKAKPKPASLQFRACAPACVRKVTLLHGRPLLGKGGIGDLPPDSGVQV